MADLRTTPDITAFVVARLKDAEPRVRTSADLDRHMARCEMVDRHRLQPSWLVPPGFCDFDGERWPCYGVRGLASRFADHPDYKAEEWAL